MQATHHAASGACLWRAHSRSQLLLLLQLPLFLLPQRAHSAPHTTHRVPTHRVAAELVLLWLGRHLGGGWASEMREQSGLVECVLCRMCSLSEMREQSGLVLLFRIPFGEHLALAHDQDKRQETRESLVVAGLSCVAWQERSMWRMRRMRRIRRMRRMVLRCVAREEDEEDESCVAWQESLSFLRVAWRERVLQRCCVERVRLPLDVTLMMCWGVGDRGGGTHGARRGAQKAHALLFLPPPARGSLSPFFDGEERRERKQWTTTPRTTPRTPSTTPCTGTTYSRRTRTPRRRAGGKAGQETKARARRLVEAVLRAILNGVIAALPNRNKRMN